KCPNEIGMDFTKEGQPCEKRVCVGADEIFKKGTKLMKQRDASAPSTSKITEEEHVNHSSECPATKESLGRASWTFLHTMTAYYPEKPSEKEQETAKQFVHQFSKIYPCEPCAIEMREDLKEIPPQVGSRDEFAGWMCLLHNRVNEKLGKDLFDCSKVLNRWRYGPEDGSCGPREKH
ncbi:hypothetical protein PENTCL1PPCAC_26937, partial [Pristionchus entomophagus]